MYLSISEWYRSDDRKTAVTLHRATEVVFNATEQTSPRDRIGSIPHRFIIEVLCPQRHSKVSEQLLSGFRVTQPLPRNDLAVPGLGTAPKSQSP